MSTTTYGTAVKEASDSPKWNFEETVKCTRTFTGSYAACKSFRLTNGYMGYLAVPADGEVSGMTVTSAELARTTGDRGILTISYSGPDEAQHPPKDTFNAGGDRTEKPLESHPRYKDTFDTPGSDAGDNRMRAIKKLLQEQGDTARDEDKIGGYFAKDYVTSGTAVYNALVREVYLKFKRGMTHYVIYPPKITRKSYYADPPTMHPGGTRETPWAPAGVTLPEGEWLREADQLDETDTWWVLTQTWIGGDLLDHDVYPETLP